ncbi:MAG TPA: hypothetical protein VL984_09550 [Acidimicrobiales bacterium]|nr:hypothetical protein [Acidimicrobiales bacterium]
MPPARVLTLLPSAFLFALSALGGTFVLSVSSAGANGEGSLVTVSPSVVTPTPQYAQGTTTLLGSGAVVTVTVGPNKVLRPGWPIEVMECDAHPTSENDCDALTTLPYDQVTKDRVPASSDGSVTTHFLLWAPLPDRWDAGSVIEVGPGEPTALWVGDDPSNWSTTGLVTSPVTVASGTAQSADGAGPATRGGHQGVRGKSGGSSPTALIIVVVAAVLLAVLLAGALTSRRHRRAGVR